MLEERSDSNPPPKKWRGLAYTAGAVALGVFLYATRGFVSRFAREGCYVILGEPSYLDYLQSFSSSYFKVSTCEAVGNLGYNWFSSSLGQQFLKYVAPAAVVGTGLVGFNQYKKNSKAQQAVNSSEAGTQMTPRAGDENRQYNPQQTAVLFRACEAFKRPFSSTPPQSVQGGERCKESSRSYPV